MLAAFITRFSLKKESFLPTGVSLKSNLCLIYAGFHKMLDSRRDLEIKAKLCIEVKDKTRFMLISAIN